MILPIRTSLSLALIASLGLAACGGDGSADAAGAPAETASTQPVALEAATREVRCGCKIDQVGHCGNYVAVGDRWLEISNPDDHGLGHMEWCSVDIKVEAVVAGTQEGDKVHVDSMELAGK